MRTRASVLSALVLTLVTLGLSQCASSRRTRAPSPAVAAPRADNSERPLRAVAIAAGRSHVCARTADGKVLCWGANASGQLGDGTRVQRTRPTWVTALDDADLLVAGDEHTCARKKRDQDLVCWGQNAHGELGDGTTDGRAAPAPVADLHAVLSVSAGGHMTCARKSNRFVMCWGEVHDEGAIKVPTPVFGMTETEEIAVGAHHACARLGPPDAEKGSVRCWGSNRLRQLGVPHVVDRGLPVQVPHLAKAAELSLGHEHSCARTEPGAALCWGGGLRCVPGEWFEGKRVAVKPGAIPGMEKVAHVAAGSDQACAILEDGSVRCAREKTVTGDRSCLSEPIAGLTSVAALALGDGFGCALKGDETVSCWGKNDVGQLGDGTTQSRATPVMVRLAR